jgi:hypothetical protein
MKKAPYISNSGNACALACYTMAAQYLLPDAGITFEKMAKIADWRKGYVVWGFPVWKWLMDRGVYLTDYDTIDYEAWAKEGAAGLKRSVPQKEFAFYQKNTYDLEAESTRVNLMYNHPHFTYIRRSPGWNDIVAEHEKPDICDLTLNLRKLNHEEGFAVHRVVLLDITEDEAVFHDPNRDGSGAYRREPLQHFKQSIASLGSPELARYSLG